MEIVRDGKFLKTSALDYNQFVRGRLFVYVDSLFTNLNVTECISDDMENILTFGKNVINFIVDWLSYFPSLIDRVTRE
jgi:hypothetical protein